MASRNPIPMAILLIFAITLAMADEDPHQNDPQLVPGVSFYDVLSSNGLPVGLFPNGISNFSVDPESGVFRLLLQAPSPCDTVFETRLRYEYNITGRLNYGRISNLTGVSAQELFLWLPVKGIQVDIPSSGLIYFDAEVVSKQFSLSLFETPKDCSSEENADVKEPNDTVVSDSDLLQIPKENECDTPTVIQPWIQNHSRVNPYSKIQFNLI